MKRQLSKPTYAALQRMPGREKLGTQVEIPAMRSLGPRLAQAKPVLLVDQLALLIDRRCRGFTARRLFGLFRLDCRP